MKPRTILHTIETAGPGGAENVFLNLSTGLDPRRFRSLALVPEGRWLPQKLREKGVPTTIAESRGRNDLSVVRSIVRLVRQEKVDLIHSHLPDQNFYSCLAGRFSHCTTVVTYHGAPSISSHRGVKGALKNWVVRRAADSIVVVSEYLRDLLISSGFPAGKVVRIYNGVDPGRTVAPHGNCLRHELGLPEEIRLVGTVANLRKSKGYEYFLRSAVLVAENCPHARFVAVGEIDEKIGETMLALRKELGLEDKFFFLGFREDVGSILSNFDVFVLPSVNEGLSIATIEAMAAGRPVVATRSGGPQEIVEQGRTGLLVPPGDPEALAAAIVELLGNPALASRLGGDAQTAVAEKFSLAGMIEEYQSLYDRCLNRGD